MTNQFTVLNTALRSLQAHQRALDTTGHNIANAETEGYSRQRAEMVTTPPYTRTAGNMPTDAGQVGTGVEVESINRLRDEFIDGQIRSQKQSSGMWNKRSEGLERIELIFNEPSESNLDQALTDFRDSLQELSNNPENAAVREEVKQRGQTLSDTFNDIHRRLMDYQRSLNGDVGATVDEINSIFERISDLNREIVHAEASGQDANDLRDNRDLLLDDLNELINVSSREDTEGNLNINISGINVVSGTVFNELETVDNGEAQDEVHFSHIDREVDVRGGELRGLMDVRDEELDGRFIEQLNLMAETLAEEFNAVHRTGFDQNLEQGGDFFDIDTGPEDAAQAISLDSNIRQSSAHIAAGNYSDNPTVARLDADWLQGTDDLGDFEYDYNIDVREYADDRVEFTLTEMFEGEPRESYDIEIERENFGHEIAVNEEWLEDEDGDRVRVYEFGDSAGIVDEGSNEESLDNVIQYENGNLAEIDTFETIDFEGETVDDLIGNGFTVGNDEWQAFEFYDADDGEYTGDFTGIDLSGVDEEADDVDEQIARIVHSSLVQNDIDVDDIQDDNQISVADLDEGGFIDGLPQNFRESLNTDILEQISEIEDFGFINDASVEDWDFELEPHFTFGVFGQGEANISFDPSEGSGSNATQLANVIDEDEFDALNGNSIKDYFEGTISSLGVDGQRANRMVDNNELMNEQLENQRQSISGVSLDEEMANMVKYQQGYAAAANVITTLQQNLDTLMGIVQ